MLEEEKADLICLQEVTRNARRTRLHDQPQLLADHLCLSNLYYQMNVHYRRKTGGYGNLILSRWPFRLRYSGSLTLGQRIPRGFQVVVVATSQGASSWSTGILAYAKKSGTGRSSNSCTIPWVACSAICRP